MVDGTDFDMTGRVCTWGKVPCPFAAHPDSSFHVRPRLASGSSRVARSPIPFFPPSSQLSGWLAFANSVVPVSSGRYDSSSTCSTIDGSSATHCLEWLHLSRQGLAGRARLFLACLFTWRLDGDGQKPVPPQIPRPKEERILEADVSQPRGKALAYQGYQSSVAWREGVCCPAAVGWGTGT